MTSTSCELPPRSTVDDHETDDGSAAKRRKIRKGTRSCWECRQRKMKCIFTQPTDSTCVRCHRRGAKCVSQEYPEEITSSLDRSLQMGDRMIRVEKLVEKLLNRESTDDNPSGDKRNDTFAPETLNSRPSQAAASFKSLEKPETAGFEILNGNVESFNSEVIQNSHVGFGKYEKLSQTLHASIPSSNNIRTIIKACGNTSALFYQMQIVPYNDLDKTKSLESMFARPSLNVHPVLIARHMLHIATALQHLHPDFAKGVNRLSEPPREMMRRLSSIAINIVTTNDDLVYCIEGLDCLMIESWFHTNGGNLRKGLTTTRRAMTIAQLMGFHRPGKARCKVVDQKTKCYPEFIWHRITALERYLCLMLGLPQTATDHMMASEEMLLSDTPIGRLDRIHSVVTSRILQRNELLSNPHDFALAQHLDEELQQASKFLPDKWWLMPNLATVADQPEALFWDMRRLFHHLFHYNLLIQLHLPYMLSSATAGHRYGSSQIICVNSSREILSRFSMFHSFNQIAFSCRTVDFFGLMAAMTLLIVHIDGHQHRFPSSNRLQSPPNPTIPTNNLFAHQRPSDRALIENLLDIMDEVSRVELETMSIQISSILRRLMDIEAEAAEQAATQIPATREVPSLSNSRDSVQMSIPHFGVINVTRDGIFVKDSPQSQREISDAEQPSFQVYGRPTMKSARVQAGDGSCTGVHGMQPEARTRTSTQQAKENLPAETNVPPCESLDWSQGPVSSGVPLFQATQTNNSITSPGHQQVEEFPLNAGEHDGTPQDTELAFFDMMMRGIGIDENDSIDWLAWLNVS